MGTEEQRPGAMSRVRRAVEWAGSHEPTVYASLLVVVLGLWGFISLASEVMEGDTEKFDRKIINSLRNPDNPIQPVGPQWLVEVARDITALGGWTILVMVTLVISIYLGLDRKYLLMNSVLLANLTGVIAGMVLKAVFDRPRPDLVPHLTVVSSASFPSGHSMMSAVVYLTLGAMVAASVSRLRLKFFVMAVAILVTLVVGLSRIYLGVHYPTDVLAGWSIGFAWALMCRMLVRWYQLKQVAKLDH